MAETISSTGARSRAIVRIAFNSSQPPSLDDVYAALEKVMGPAGCTRCGFDGLDFLLQLEEIVNPEPTPWVATKIGGQVGGF